MGILQYSKLMAVVAIILAMPVMITCKGDTKYLLEVSVSPMEGGSVKPTVGKYPDNTELTLTAIPNQGFGFDHWEGDVTGTDSNLTITMNSDMSITAHFKRKMMLNISVVPSFAGAVEPEGGAYDYGVDLRLEAKPHEGYGFSHWSGDNIAGDSSILIVNMNRNRYVTAHFTEHYDLNITIEPKNTGSVNPSSGPYDKDIEITVEAFAEEGYTFDRWSGDISGNDQAMSVNIDENKDITAHFKKQYNLNISVVPDGAGKIDPIEVTFTDGDNITLDAIPAEDYVFSHWSGDYNGDSHLLNITMEEDTDLMANFKYSMHPPSAPVIHDRQLGGYGELEIDNDTSFDGVVVLTTLTNEPIMASYVRTNNTYTMEGINDGSYFIYFSLGSAWDNDTMQFTRDCTYHRFEDVFEFSSDDYSATVWSITLHGVVGGSGTIEDIQSVDFPDISR